MARYYTYYEASGTNTPDSGGDWRYYFDVTSTQNANDNSSTITAKAYIQFSNLSGLSNVYTVPAYNIIDGTSYKVSKNITTSNGSHLIGTTTRTLSHNNDGTREFTFQGSGRFDKTMNTKKVTITLPTIQRQSTPTLSVDVAILDSTKVIITTNRASTSFIHKLTYSIGNLTDEIISANVADNYEWTPPISLANQITGKETGVATITCTTYDSDGTTQVGNPTTINLTLSVPSSVVPTCSLKISEDNTSVVPSSWGVWIQGKSRIKGAITASGAYGSTITSYKSTANNQTFLTKDFITSVINFSGSHTVKSTVTDSRNRPATAEQNINVLPYKTPKVSNIIVARCNSDGSDNKNGTSAKVSFNYEISPIDNNNTITINIQYGLRNALELINKTVETNEYNGYVEIVINDYEFVTSKSYDVNIRIADYFTEETYTSEGVSTISKPISVYRGGKGIAFGKTAEEEGLFDNNFDSKFRKDVEIDGALSVNRVEGELTVDDIRCKNILDLPHSYSKTANGGTLAGKNGVFTASGTLTTATTFYFYGLNIELKAGTYTLSSNSGSIYPYINLYTGNTKINNMGASHKGVETFTITEDTTITRVGMYFSASTLSLTVKPQLEKGSVATSFTPCKDFGVNSHVKWNLKQETGINFNEYKEFGQYSVYGSCTNAPATNIGFAILEVLEYSRDWVMQRLNCISESGTLTVYQRCFYNGTTWSSWKEI